MPYDGMRNADLGVRSRCEQELIVLSAADGELHRIPPVPPAGAQKLIGEGEGIHVDFRTLVRSLEDMAQVGAYTVGNVYHRMHRIVVGEVQTFLHPRYGLVVHGYQGLGVGIPPGAFKNHLQACTGIAQVTRHANLVAVSCTAA